MISSVMFIEEGVAKIKSLALNIRDDLAKIRSREW